MRTRVLGLTLLLAAASLGSRAEKAAPSAEARARFEAEWEKRGREEAGKAAWLASRNVLVLAEPGVDAAVPPKLVAALRAQLAELGSTKFKVEAGAFPAAMSRAGCVKGEVLDEACFRGALAALRASDPRYAGAVIFYLTNAALGKLPRMISATVSEGPPAGEASWPDGWMLQSLYYRVAHLRQDPTLNAFGGARFTDHSLDCTARHELGHLLGLPHHEAIANPGFPEPIMCTACRHKGIGVHKPAHPECLMNCGSCDDAWFHQETFGKDFGLCPKCKAAATAYLKGLEGR